MKVEIPSATRLDITNFFTDEFIVGSDDYPSGKPDPSQLIDCRERIESVSGPVKKENIFYIGDVPDDIVAAKRAGFARDCPRGPDRVRGAKTGAVVGRAAEQGGAGEGAGAA